MADNQPIFPSNNNDVTSETPSFGKGIAGRVESNVPNFAKNAALTAATAVLFRRKPLEGRSEDNIIADKIRTESADVYSMLGTPVLDQVQIQAGSYFEIEDVRGQNPISYEGIVMQTALLDVSMSKNIITTQIQGLDGTIKEFVSQGDFVINISGNIVGETEGNSVKSIGQIYPKIDTERLIQICKAPSPITITSGFLQQFGINQAVITNYKFAQLEGSRSQQPFQLTLLSDNPINLEEV